MFIIILGGSICQKKMGISFINVFSVKMSAKQ